MGGRHKYCPVLIGMKKNIFAFFIILAAAAKALRKAGGPRLDEDAHGLPAPYLQPQDGPCRLLRGVGALNEADGAGLHATPREHLRLQHRREPH